MSTITDEQAIKMAMEMVLRYDLFPAKVFVASAPFDSDPPPVEVVLVDVTSFNRPQIVSRIPYAEFMTEVKKCRKLSQSQHSS